MKKTFLIIFLAPLIAFSQNASLPEVTYGSQAKHVRGFGDLIDFDAYPTGTVITDQYADSGAIFSGYGGTGNPDVYDYGVYTYGRVLKSIDWYAPIKLRFVDPLDSTEHLKIRYFGYENAAIADFDWVVVRFYDENDSMIFINAISSQIEHFASIDLGSNAASYVVFDDSLSTAYVIDSVWFAMDTIKTGIENTGSSNLESHCYPNPMNDQITFELSRWEIFPDAVLEIYDLLGKKVLTFAKLERGKAILPRKEMSGGTYFYSFKSKDLTLSSGSFVAE